MPLIRALGIYPVSWKKLNVLFELYQGSNENVRC
jgi:hypothetical protein